MPLFAQLEFTRPALLVAMLMLPLVAIWGWRSYRTASNRIASVVLRCILAACVVFAAAGPFLRVPSTVTTTVAILDRSAGVSQAEVDAAANRLDGNAIKLEFKDQDAATALRNAAAQVPASANAGVVLVSSGNHPSGDVVTAAAGVGAPVSVFPVQSFASPEVCVHSLTATPPVYPATEVALTTVVAANQAAEGQLQLLRNGEVVARSPLSLKPGRQIVRLTDAPGSLLYGADANVTYEVELTGFDDKFPANNRFKVSLPQAQSPVATVMGNRREAFSAALSAAGYRAQQKQITDWQPAAEDATPGLIILADAQLEELTPATQNKLKQYVAGGGGLIVTGGQKLFGDDKFAGSTLEEISPVTAATAEAEKKSSTALVLVIDKSKSMLEEDRMSLARAGAKRAIEVLGEQDQLGVLAFSGGADWVAPLGPVTDREALLKQIDKLQVADRTVMYPAMLRAVFALEQTVADRRHMILLTDGVSTPGDFDGLARRMKRSGIAVSTVSVGAGADQSILKDIARIAGGKHRHSEKASDLTGILVQAAREAASPQPPSSFEPIEMRMPQQMSFAAAPPLQKYAATRSRPGSQTLLVSPRGGEPLLAWRRYGKGAVATLAVDVSENGWRQWKGFPAFIQQLAGLTARGSQPRFTVASQWRGKEVVVTVDAIDNDNRFINNANLLLEPAGATGEPVKMQQIAAGRYQATLAAPGEGADLAAMITFSQPGSGATTRRISMHRNYPLSLALPAAGANQPVLKAVAAASGGGYEPAPAELPVTSTATQRNPLFVWLLMAALLAFVADIGVRRLL